MATSARCLDLITVRRPTPADRVRIQAMALRCSRSTMLARFHAPRRDISERHVAGLMHGPPLHHVLVGERAGNLVAFGSASVIGPGVAELGVLVHDGAQGQGIGTRLSDDLCEMAANCGIVELRAQVTSGNIPAIRLLHGLSQRGLTGPWAWQQVTDGHEASADLLPSRRRLHSTGHQLPASA